uniref:ATP synthase F0 subunit 8 n=1 Tax=Andrena angustior TaxID=1190793 RepID=A0A0S2LTK5_9HYME|nr:ATP synthase F0 subunit 8 [Andrena angustior]
MPQMKPMMWLMMMTMTLMMIMMTLIMNFFTTIKISHQWMKKTPYLIKWKW